jgi:hypothetical protein
MPTVPGVKAQMAQEYDQTRPTPEQVLITAADMHQRGQLTDNPTTISDPRAPLKLPFAGGGRGQRTGKSKRR